MSKGFFKNVIFPVITITLLVYMFLPICRASGELDYFLLWILVGCPFGIRKMFLWLIPSGFGIAGTVGVVALNFIVGGLIGGVVAIYRLIYAVFYLLQMMFGILTRKGKKQKKLASR